jgi:2',3'-cyclic-nucleotide 2'-phosphodiesterase (5'-nucleotidase family)
MNTRRKFLFSGSMATAALLTAKPFTSIANSLSPVTGFSINNNSLVLAHTGNAIHAGTGQVLQHIAKLKNSGANLIMLHAGDTTPALHTAYDASMHTGESFSISTHDYKIVYKGDIKTGVITANNKSASADKINALAVYLKKEKNCHLVVCLSQLGYKSKTGLDDMSLAAYSTHLDIIIGGHITNFCKSPMTTLNKNKEEVIINHAGTNGLAFRKIEIGFDNRGRKNQLAFTRTSLPA